MNDSLTIYKKAMALRKKEYRSLEELISMLGILLYERDNFATLLGLYTAKMHQRVILLNSRVEGFIRLMVLAHEIGHDQLHRNYASCSFLQEETLFFKGDRIEYEANAFAAHLLIDEKEMMMYLRFGMSVEDAAKNLGVDVNLLLIKLKEMKNMGMDLALPFEPDAMFFANYNI